MPYLSSSGQHLYFAKDYSKVFFLGLYRKPVFIFLTVCGFYMIVTSILDHFKIINYYSDTPYLEIFGGLFLFLLPTLIVVIAVRQFLSNPSFHEIKCTFSENGMTVQELTFKGEFIWAGNQIDIRPDTIYKIKS